MKTIILMFIISVSSIIANEGYEVYKQKCQQCHIEMISKSETKKRFANLKAPPMIEVANQLKNNIIIKDDDEDVHRQVVVAFIKEYIDNPDLQYTMCHPMAIDKFGIMPSLKGQLSDKEKQVVAEWIYDRYEGKEFK
ncbi:MAG: c-type cytochrome [Campylobacterota bacterium]|nr:c-type cytochrome [Campylobacterota bacterium]